MKHAPTPPDRDLIVLYRRFSEEMWCAGWIGSPESMADEFVKWLQEDHRSDLAEWEAQDYEVAALPTLRRLYAEALNGPRR